MSERKARFKRRTSHVPNLMLVSKTYCSCSLALDSAHVKFDVLPGPYLLMKCLTGALGAIHMIPE